MAICASLSLLARAIWLDFQILLWRETPARIVGYRMATNAYSDLSGIYHLKVRFAYESNGHSQLEETWCHTGWKEDIGRFTNKHPVGGIHTLRVSPFQERRTRFLLGREEPTLFAKLEQAAWNVGSEWSNAVLWFSVLAAGLLAQQKVKREMRGMDRERI